VATIPDASTADWRRRWLGFLILILAAQPSAAAEGETVFEFERLNRSYAAFIEELEAVTLGPATIELSSPEHTLTLLRHRASLRPLGNGLFAVDLEVRLFGQGTLEADVTFGRVHSQLSDRVAVPAQGLELAGVAAISASVDGFLVEARELQPTLEVRVESELAGRLVALCHQMVLVLVSVDCPVLEESLERLSVPLPPPGTTYLLPYDELTEAERVELERYLAANR
jgi:hypothetical protein